MSNPEYINPFEYEAASKFTSEQLLDYYIEDYNYSRFVRSKRNIFLVGERGTGKSMILLYNSLPVQMMSAEQSGTAPDLSIVSVYVPCNTTLFHRREHELLDSLHGALSSEHSLVTSIMQNVVSTIAKIPNLVADDEESAIRAELEYVLKLDLPKDFGLFDGLGLALERSSHDVQEALNGSDEESHLYNLRSFSSGLRPLLNSLARIERLSHTHFSLMIDDIQLLDEYQMGALNSWIAYRDNSLFSFKVATTRIDAPTRRTSSGGSILESHDFTEIEMEQPYQNTMSAFGKLAKEIITKRLSTIDIQKTPEEFFPVNESMEKDFLAAENQAREEAEDKYPSGTNKQKNDYVYKYARAIYFRSRAGQSNRPPYSGFELLVHLSTGVIRNLLDPCWHMYDRIYSEESSKGVGCSQIESIPTPVQTEIIQSRSKKKWEWMQNELASTIENCSQADAVHVYQLMDNLAILFRDRLLEGNSEPRAVTFTISAYSADLRGHLDPILTIARKAQLLYTYTSSAKDSGKREKYYVPNRILWPERGLDPQGQHARVSIKAEHLWNAANQNTKIPIKENKMTNQPDLFDDER